MLRLAQRLVRGEGAIHRGSFIAVSYRASAPSTSTVRAASSFILTHHYAPTPATLRKTIHTTPTTFQAITPDSSAPSPASSPIAAPANISIEEYHELADRFLNDLVVKLEGLSEHRDDVDVEYNVNTIFLFLLCNPRQNNRVMVRLSNYVDRPVYSLSSFPRWVLMC
jgi:hypothetical protein